SDGIVRLRGEVGSDRRAAAGCARSGGGGQGDYRAGAVGRRDRRQRRPVASLSRRPHSGSGAGIIAGELTMHMSRIFIERPVMTTLVTFAILLFGWVGFRALPVAALPSVDYPTIHVTAFQPGASPETMASSIATPLEREFSTIAGVQSMSSSNVQGSTTITIQFDLDKD